MFFFHIITIIGYAFLPMIDKFFLQLSISLDTLCPQLQCLQQSLDQMTLEVWLSFGAETLLPLTKGAPAVPQNTISLCWFYVSVEVLDSCRCSCYLILKLPFFFSLLMNSLVKYMEAELTYKNLASNFNTKYISHSSIS